MKMEFRAFDLRLSHEWTVANSATGQAMTAGVVLTRLEEDGVFGLGEAAPSMRYGENKETVIGFLSKIDPQCLSFSNIPGSMAYLEGLGTGNWAAKAAINIALVDGAARKAGKAVYNYLNLGFSEKKHVTSFTIGIAQPEQIRKKVLEAADYPILKLKLGSANDKETLAALRSAARDKTLRVDANEGWKTKETALRNLEWLAEDSHVEFVEQPMPAGTALEDWVWLKKRSPLPLFGDESYHSAGDVDFCAKCFHGVNVKLVKTGGISGAYEALKAARKAGLKTMIGCMIESSVLITAAAHLAELTDYLDIDGNLLISNDPFLGVKADRGVISFEKAPGRVGLRVEGSFWG